MNKYLERIYNGIIKENPILILLLGMCPTLAGAVREILGSGTVFGYQVLPKTVEPIGIFIQPPGAFLVIALFIIIMNAAGIKTRQRKLVENSCDGKCASCAENCEWKEDAK